MTVGTLAQVPLRPPSVHPRTPATPPGPQGSRMQTRPTTNGGTPTLCNTLETHGVKESTSTSTGIGGSQRPFRVTQVNVRHESARSNPRRTSASTSRPRVPGTPTQCGLGRGWETPSSSVGTTRYLLYSGPCPGDWFRYVTVFDVGVEVVIIDMCKSTLLRRIGQRRPFWL